MTDFEFLKGRFQMFFGFMLAAVWSGLEIAAVLNQHLGEPSAEFTGFIIGINCIFIGANSSGTAKVAQFVKGYIQNKAAMNHVLAQERLQYRIKKDRAILMRKGTHVED
jgi:hypothetical protein